MNKRKSGGGDDRDDKKPKAAAAAANPPPANVLPVPPHLMLHQHALQSIFKFLSLRELHVVLSVSNRWCSAVSNRSMQRINATLDHSLNHPLTLNFDRQRLQRHVTKVSGATLQIYPNILECLPHLTFLSLTLPHLIVAPFVHVLEIPQFPSCLETLRLHESATPGIRINYLLRLAADLQQLKRFYLLLTRPIAPVNFKPLHQAPKLTHFVVSFLEDDAEEINLGIVAIPNLATNQQVKDLRELPHQERSVVTDLRAQRQLLFRLMASPHQLKWKTFGFFSNLTLVRMDADWYAALFHLPSLTQLFVEFGQGYAVSSTVPYPLCLQPLVNLEELNLTDNIMPDGIDANELFNTLRQMRKLKVLLLGGCELTSQHMAELLPQLPDLVELQLNHCRRIVSLNFLVAPVNTRPFCSLTRLTIRDCPVENEPQHLHGLKHLVQLRIHVPFVRQFRVADWSSLNPPSSILLELTDFRLAISADDDSPHIDIYY